MLSGALTGCMQTSREALGGRSCWDVAPSGTCPNSQGGRCSRARLQAALAGAAQDVDAAGAWEMIHPVTNHPAATATSAPTAPTAPTSALQPSARTHRAPVESCAGAGLDLAHPSGAPSLPCPPIARHRPVVQSSSSTTACAQCRQALVSIRVAHEHGCADLPPPQPFACKPPSSHSSHSSHRPRDGPTSERLHR